MKKILKGVKIMALVFICNLFITQVYAASAKIGVSSSSKQVVVGNTVKVYITLSSSANLGSWEFDVKYDSDVLSFVSSNLEGNTRSVGVVNSSGVKSKTYTMTFKAKKSGQASVNVRNANVAGFDESEMSVSTGSVSIKTITQKELESSYSSDNNLSSLSINGYKLTPDFSKNTTSYSLTVPNDVNSVTVSAKTSDSKARVSGIGKVNLKEGSNRVNITVTAENGNKKTYSINITVKELNPITVKIGEDEYTVVRKKDGLSAPSTYTDATAMINGEEVPAFRSSITNYLLVGLTDKNGDVKLYIYKNDEFTLYNEVKFGGVSLYNMEPPEDKLIKDTEKKTITIDSKEIEAYILKDFAYPLIYGINVETGEENWYTYDSSENTLQKYVATNPKVVETINNVSKSNDKYKILSFILGGISGVLLIFLIIATIKISVQKKKEVI